MFSPPDPDNSYMGLKNRMVQHLKSANVQEQIKDVLMRTYENALAQENIVLSRPERKRLFVQITQQILNDMLDETYGYAPPKE